MIHWVLFLQVRNSWVGFVLLYKYRLLGVFVCIGTCTGMGIYGYVQVHVHVHSTEWIDTDTRRHYGAYGGFVDEVDGGLELSWF